MTQHLVYPGSFDPVTRGHLDVITRASALCEKLTVLVTYNPQKQGMFSAEERASLIRRATRHLPNVAVDTWSGLLVDYPPLTEDAHLVKGLRTTTDFEYEMQMAQFNRAMKQVESLFLVTDPALSYISSTLVKEIAKYGGDISSFVVEEVESAIREKLNS